jgi:hypothetical protein
MKKITQKKVISQREENTRRKFLKKAVYSAPGLIVLGQLAKPVNALGSDDDFSPGGDFGGGDSWNGR